MEFQWDEEKDRSNRAKHGVAFLQAVEALEDVNEYGGFDAYYDGEARYWSVGAAASLIVLFVVYSIRQQGDRISTRIISARRATRSEQRQYEQGRKDR